MIQSVLMLGQSNMAGRGFLDEVPMIINERIQMLRNGRWQMMMEPVNYDRPVAGVGLTGSFAQQWCQTNDTGSIGLIPCAEGGSTIDEWAPDGILFRHAVIQAKFAMETSELTAILWHQGESDSYNGKYIDYYEKLHVIIETLKKELHLGDIPIIIGGLPDFLGKTGFGQNCVEYQQINEVLVKFAKEQENCYFVTAVGLTANPDGIHIDATSQRKFGLRYFDAFDKKRHVLNPLKDEDTLVQMLMDRTQTENERMYSISMEFALGSITYEDFVTKATLIHQTNE
ncbi:MAG: sialate O-acetylesterase [Culicoidibacterales bacterium]